MLSIRKREFFTSIPIGLILIMSGLTVLFFWEPLSNPISWRSTCIILLGVLGPLFSSYYYVWRNKNRFEPYDELTERNVSKAYEFYHAIHLIFWSLVALIIVFTKPDLKHHHIVGFLFLYNGTTYIVKYLLFIAIEKWGI